MVETDKHLKLKKMAKTMLVNMGFSLDEIYEEYRLEINSVGINKKRYYIVDVCGISKEKNRNNAIDKTVAIECGKTSGEKIVNLNLFFDEVYHLPYGLQSTKNFDDVYEKAIKQIAELKEELSIKNTQINTLKNNIARLNRKIEAYRDLDLLVGALYVRTYPYGFTVSDNEKAREILSKLDMNNRSS